MHTRRRLTFAVGALGVVFVCLAGWLSRTHRAVLPWEEAGSLIVLVRAAPNDRATESITLDVSSLSLVEDGVGDDVPIAEHQVTLDPARGSFTVVASTSVRTGEYGGYTLVLTNPEAPHISSAIELPYPILTIPTPFAIALGRATVLLVSIETDSSLHVGTSTAQLFPTLTTELRSDATVELAPDGVQCAGGTLSASELYGMDRTGVLRHNYREPRDRTQW